MIHNTEKQLAYDEGVDAGIKEGVEQTKIEMIINLKDKLSVEEIAEVANVSAEKVSEILKGKQKINFWEIQNIEKMSINVKFYKN